MDKLLEKSKNLILIAVAFSLLASFFAFLSGAVKTVSVIAGMVWSYGKDPHAGISLIELMDTFLIATALFIFSVGMYELFFKELNLPDWLTVHNLHDLKAKLGSVIVLVMAVTFLKHLVEWNDPTGTLFFGIAVAVVSGALIAFSHFGGKD
ncbi:MAG: YqhA family protein [Thermodesulfovibrionales bacterium]|jgi:uncharacterized membrane protein YqhA